MDNLRGHFSDYDPFEDHDDDFGLNDDETGREPPPSIVGQDERRMQVRAYNFWAGLLQNRNFPSIEDLDPDQEQDFGPYSVLLDFTNGIENPAIGFLGDKLAQECGTIGPIGCLNDVPSRSLLSRITDHYLQILANQAPIGFEAEFINQRGITILYRGILLPFSSDDDTIDFIYGVINWKELADQQTADELLLEIDQALQAPMELPSNEEATAEQTEPTDEPVATESKIFDVNAVMKPEDDDILDLGTRIGDKASGIELPKPEFSFEASRIDFDFSAEPTPASSEDEPALDEKAVEVSHTEIELPETDVADMALADLLASARELAEEVRICEDRTRKALYAAIGRAYDFSLAARQAPDEFDQLVTDSGLTIQDRARMTPVVKLVFGIDYDKTRLAEYAAVLDYAHRKGIESGALAGFLASAPGGLKAIVKEERMLRKGVDAEEAADRMAPREALARKLRKLETRSLNEVATDGSEFTVLVARRLENGEVVLLGEISDDIPLIEKAARKLLK